MRFVRCLRDAWDWFVNRWRYDLKVVDVQGDELPEKIGKKELIRMIDAGQEWSVAMLCPCGCGDTIEMMLLRSVKPRWDLHVARGLPTLTPSVWRNVGCRSHFWVRRGRVVWVR